MKIGAWIIMIAVGILFIVCLAYLIYKKVKGKGGGCDGCGGNCSGCSFCQHKSAHDNGTPTDDKN